MTETTYDPLTEAVRELTDPRREIGDVEQEIVLASKFVLRFGPLGDVYDEPELTAVQFAPAAGGAWSYLAHWSVRRGDPRPRADVPPAQYCIPSCPVCWFLEEIAVIRAGFQEQDCRLCGGDLDDHDAVMDGEGLPQVLCRGGWQREYYEPELLARLCRDQHGNAYAARWIAPLADGTLAVVTRTYLLVRYDEGEPETLCLQRIDRYTNCRRWTVEGAEDVIAEVAQTHTLESADPAESPYSLAATSFEPEPGEWHDNMPDSAPFRAVN